MTVKVDSKDTSRKLQDIEFIMYDRQQSFGEKEMFTLYAFAY